MPYIECPLRHQGTCAHEECALFIGEPEHCALTVLALAAKRERRRGNEPALACVLALLPRDPV